MTLDLQQLLLLGLLCASTHWIIARSKVMRWFWSRLRGWRADLLACPACSGFWLGLVTASIGLRPVTLAIAGAPHAARAAEIITAGVLAVFMTPVCQAVMLWGLSMSAIESAPESPAEPEPVDPDAAAPAPTTLLPK